MGASIRVERLRKSFLANGVPGRGERLVLHDLSFQVHAGEFFAVVGPSGCGKSTLLNVLGGFLPYEGEVLTDEQPVIGPGSDRVLVFQEFGLFDWKTVLDNVALGLVGRGLSRSEARARAEPYLDLVRLGDVRDRYPYQLSVGMKQRLALARALAVEPSCLLLDEPLGALDYLLRIRMQHELLELWERTQKTIVLVTHDLEEAIYLADRILVLTALPGRVDQIVSVDLPRPRTLEMRTGQRSDELRRYLWSRLAPDTER